MEANTYVPIAGILDLLNKFPGATPCLRSLLLALPGHVPVFSSSAYSSHTASIRGPAGPRAGALPEMSLSEQHFNLQSALLALGNSVHLPPATARHAPPLWSGTTGRLSVLYLHMPWAPPSSAVLGTFNQKAPDYPCPFPKTPTAC